VSSIIWEKDTSIAEASDEKPKNIKKKMVKNMFNIINHMGDLKSFQERKFMFLRKSLYNTRVLVPPLSTMNIPNMIMVDFNSKRFDSNNNSHSFQISNSSVDFLERFDSETEETRLDHRDMTESEIEEMLDDMVLVMKNNLTGLSTIPVK
jgi:hypothetical protein